MIPKKIHFCWLSGDTYPPLIAHCIESWTKHLPDYEFILWDKAKIDIEQIPWVKEAFENKKYAFAADFIRLYAVYTEGGIYLDSDVEVVNNFNELLTIKSFIGLETGGDFEPAIFGAEANCEWLGKCLAYYEGRHFIKPDGSFDTRPLPTIVGAVMNDTYEIKPTVGLYEQLDLEVFSADYFSPKSTHTQKINRTKNTRAIHHFDGAWVEKDFKYRLKNFIHQAIIFCIGQTAHNRLIAKIRDNGKI